MRLLYLKPELKDLSQGSRIAFVRQFRRLTQDYIAGELGLSHDNKRRIMTRYEKGNRCSRDDRTLELSKILNVSFNAIKKYDFNKPIDLIYMFMWLEELIPNYQIDLLITPNIKNEDIDNIYYIDYDYWNELSNSTSKPTEAAKNIKNGVEIFDISNKPFLDGVEYLKNRTFPPVILITCNDEKFLIIEGHSRMTVYGIDQNKLRGTYAYIGYCTPEDMKKYDVRMLKDVSLKSIKH